MSLSQIDALLETSNEIVKHLWHQIDVKIKELEALNHLECEITSKIKSFNNDKTSNEAEKARLNSLLDQCVSDKQNTKLECAAEKNILQTKLDQCFVKKQDLESEMDNLQRANQDLSSSNKATRERLQELERQGQYALDLFGQLAKRAEKVPEQIDRVTHHLEETRRSIANNIKSMTDTMDNHAHDMNNKMTNLRDTLSHLDL